MKIIKTEEDFHNLPESVEKKAILEMLTFLASMTEYECDLVEEHGEYIIIEDSDDISNLVLDENSEPIDLTDFDTMLYESITREYGDSIFDLVQVFGEGSARSFIVPNKVWLNADFKKQLCKRAFRI